MASMSAVRRSLRQVATFAARRGAVAVSEAAPARAIVAGEFRSQVSSLLDVGSRGGGGL